MVGSMTLLFTFPSFINISGRLFFFSALDSCLEALFLSSSAFSLLPGFFSLLSVFLFLPLIIKVVVFTLWLDLVSLIFISAKVVDPTVLLFSCLLNKTAVNVPAVSNINKNQYQIAKRRFLSLRMRRSTSVHTWAEGSMPKPSI